MTGPETGSGAAKQWNRDAVTVRSLASAADFQAALELQRSTWGDGFSDLVPAHVMKVAQRVGGVAAGAFAADGTMLGFVFGITGLLDGEPVHWSDMLAVREDHRGSGIGRLLKEHQRQVLAGLGVRTIQWSFDPLVARNAHLNLGRLGARVLEYVLDMYPDSDSPLHRGFGTDRLILSWTTADDAVHAPMCRPVDAPPINVDAAGHPQPTPAMAGHAEAASIVIPEDIHSVLRTDPDTARAWRDSTRAAFLAALGSGYRVETFVRASVDRPPHYVLLPEPGR
jgi:predicted GNAT superfamily acetyltransferase